MSQLRLTLLGQVAVHKDGVPVTGFKSSKAVAVLCYLAVTGQPCARTTLVGLLWSELPEANALMNLRHVLANLRELVGEHIEITRHTVVFQRASDYWLDVEQFAAAVNGFTTGDISEQPLHTALELYQGDFLAGLEVRQAPEFEDWLRGQRTHLRARAVLALKHLADHASASGELEQAIAYIQRLLTLEPWREEAHRQLMGLLARNGQINAALVQYERCRQALAEQLATEPAPETTALYQRLRTISQTPHRRLPTQTTPFVGRTTELALIARYLADPTCRCLTLVGPGGIGKTRLALEAASGQLHHFLQGVAFVPLTAVSAAEFMAPAIAAALQLALDGEQEPATQLLHYLAEREVLLVLDNLEHLLMGRRLLADILAHAPQVKLLATSRERLNLKAEWVIDVGGLAFPFDAATRPLQEYSAVQLFVETARRVQTDFEISDTNAAAIVRICRLLEGMPLGIELAAAWVRTLECDVIASELEGNLDLLTTEQPDVPERHQSMHVVFSQSWGLLSTTQQKLLGELAVFRRGFRQEAAQTICRASWRDLAALMEKSLLQRNEQGRFSLHELLRQFAAEKYATASIDEEQPLEQRHCLYYLDWLTGHAENLHGEEPQLAVAVVQSEIENLRQAWQWAIRHGEWAALEHCLPAWRRFYHLRGLYTEAGNWLAEALRHWQAQADERMIDATTQRVKGHLLVYAADIFVMQAQYQQALQYAQEADKLATQTADLTLKGETQAMLGYIHRVHHAPELALAHQQRAAQLLLETGERRLYANLLLQMGKTYEQMHHWDNALAVQEEALCLFQALSDQGGSAASLAAMGAVHYGAGNLAQALACDRRALMLAQRMNAQIELVRSHAEIGRVYWRIRQHEEALAHFHQALALATDLGLVHRVSRYHHLIGEIYKERRQFVHARIHLEQAVQLAQKVDALAELVGALGTLSLLSIADGDPNAALEQSQRALQVAERLADPRQIAICAGRLGQMYAKLGQLPQARALLEQAVDDLQALGIHTNEPALPHTLNRLANVLYQQGEYAMAEAHCHTVLRMLHEHAQTMFESQMIERATMLTLARCRYAQGDRDEAISFLLNLLETAEDSHDRSLLFEILEQFTPTAAMLFSCWA